MKNTFLISVIVLTFCLASKAQSTYICQPDTLLVYTDHSIIEGDSMLIFNAYDSEGLFTQCKKYYDDDWTKGKLDQATPPIQNQTDYEYDLNHNMVKITYRWFSGPRPGRDVSYYTYQDGRLSLYIKQYIDFLGDTHSQDSVIYQYDAQGRIQEEVAYQALGETLVLSKHAVYEYDADKVVLTTEGLENGSWGDWLQLSKETKTYNEEGLVSNVVSESYNETTKSTTYSYDTEGRVSSILTKVWDSLDWVNRTLLEYSYDASGHLTLAEIKSWQEGVFVNANRAVYELNEVGYPTVVTFEKWDGEEWIQGTWKSGFHIFSQDYLKRQNDFVCRRDAKRIEIHYAVTPIPSYDVEEHQDGFGRYTLYPNPTTGLVTVKGQDLKQAEVFNTLGQSVATVKGKGDTLQIDLSGLPTGVYFVNVTDSEGRKCVRKVVKE